MSDVPTKKGSNKIGFWKRIYVLRHGRFPISTQTEESVTVKALKKHQKALEEIIEKQKDLMSDMTEQMKIGNDASVQDKLIDMAAKVLMPQSDVTQQTPPRVVQDSGHTSTTDMNDEQIKALLNHYDPKLIQSALLIGDDYLATQIRENFPSLSDKSIQRGLEIAREI